MPASPMTYDGKLTCALECSDLEKAIQWYEQVLGFTKLYIAEEIGWGELQSPVADTTVGLSQVESPSVKGGATLTFGVSDVRAARGHLEAQGVKFDGETVTYPGMVSLATFYDLDGNTMMLAQDLSQEG
ncbi:MAG: VOC family protein [Myxococcota bacterium]